MTSTEFQTIAGECADDVRQCVDTCRDEHGVDLEALAACRDDIDECLASAADRSECRAVAEACLADAAGDWAALRDCVGECRANHDACIPEEPERPELPDGVGECVDTHRGCVAECAGTLTSCERPTVQCDTGTFEDLRACLMEARQNRDFEAAAACLQDAAGACMVDPGDRTCLEGARDCFVGCHEDVRECLGN